jgi:hypothetical protein
MSAGEAFHGIAVESFLAIRRIARGVDSKACK